MQVEMGLSSASFSFDYFDEHLTAQYIDALVFINEKLHSEKTDVSKSTLEKLAQDAGLDDTLKTELNEELANMLKVVEKSADESFGSWQDIHKASLVVDRLVALAPLNPEVIYAAIYFYAYTLCNAFFDSLGVRYGKDAKIYVSQPRRIAATSIRDRIAAKLGPGKVALRLGQGQRDGGPNACLTICTAGWLQVRTNDHLSRL